MTAIDRLLGPFDGERVAGGCDHCDADQSVEPVQAGVWVVHVFHDGECPTLRALGHQR
jgi:hypothetical protein